MTTDMANGGGIRKRKPYPYRPRERIAGDAFIPLNEVCVRLGMSQRSVYNHANSQGFPPLVKCGGKVGMLDSALTAFLKKLPLAEVS